LNLLLFIDIMKNIILLILNFLTFSSVYCQNNLDEGLFFSSHEVIQDKRTSLNITPEKPFSFENKFAIEFESNFRKRDGLYGSIFRIIDNKEFNIDLVANLGDRLKPNNENFWLVVNNDILVSFQWKDIPNGGVDKWIKFKLEIDAKSSLISLSINGEKRTKKIKDITDLQDFEIVFGKSNLKNFVTTDVCPMSLKNVKIYNNNNLVRNWILGKHLKNNKVYDEVQNEIAIASNPKWLLDQHIFWNKQENLKFDNFLGTTQDDKGKRIFFIDQKAVYVYHLNNRVIDTLKYSNKPFLCLGTSFIYNQYTDELWSYSFDKNSISKFNFKTSAWSDIKGDCLETNYWHHNKMISPKDKNLLTFGGYGNYQYKNEIQNFDSKASVWATTKTSNPIEPRYLSSSGILNNDKFLIFGGFGSKSGSQVANSRYYYDLYTIDFDGFKTHQLWKKSTVEGAPFVPTESMVIDSKSNSFYSLIYDNSNYNTTLKLARFGINEYNMTVFPDSIPYKFLDIKSNASFFLDAAKSNLYAVTSIDGDIELYSLSFPPLLPSEVYQKENSSIIPYEYLIILAAILSATGLFLYIRKSRKKPQSSIIKDEKYELDTFKSLQLADQDKQMISSIYLFGGFQVYDKEGKDITSLFTPTLKQLFLLILLSRSKNEKGITSFKVIEHLWYDKSENSARNNKNVNLSKLKLVLEKIGEVEMSNENTYWTINLGEKVFCDYSYVIKTLGELNNDLCDEEKINKFLSIISVGEFCPDIQNDWIDIYKVDIANRLIDGLDHLSKTKKDLSLLELIANIILKYDPLNEDAIIIKCRTLYAMGKKGHAKQSYDDFCREYFSLLDAQFNVPFKDIIKNQ
jgi:DNA-binding SARP family transcriptional activator